MTTYFPRAKHSNVILEASMAVVSGNFTLMSAGYFLSSPGGKKVNYIKNEKTFRLFLFPCSTNTLYQPSSGGKGMRGMNLEKTLFPIIGLET